VGNPTFPVSFCTSGHKKTAPEEIPRGGVIFLEAALPNISARHEIHHDD
jgi:hypothetical protein